MLNAEHFSKGSSAKLVQNLKLTQLKCRSLIPIWAFLAIKLHFLHKPRRLVRQRLMLGQWRSISSFQWGGLINLRKIKTLNNLYAHDCLTHCLMSHRLCFWSHFRILIVICCQSFTWYWCWSLGSSHVARHRHTWPHHATRILRSNILKYGSPAPIVVLAVLKIDSLDLTHQCYPHDLFVMFLQLI